MLTVEQEHRRLFAATALRVDRVSAEVLSALRDAGIRALLLKGPANRHWLYGERELRTYCDTDLLVSPADVGIAAQTLARLGFRRGQAAWLGIAQSWNRSFDVVDLHRSLLGIGVQDKIAWKLLSSEVSIVAVDGLQAEALAPPARALHVALHAAQHGTEEVQPLEDLARALRIVDVRIWRLAHELSRELSAEGAFATGLRLLETGAELAARLGATPLRPAAVALRGGNPPPVALGVALLAESGNVGVGLRVLGRGIAPTPDYMRRWSQLARRGRKGLALAYAWRVVWLIWHAPGAITSWWRAKCAESG